MAMLKSLKAEWRRKRSAKKLPTEPTNRPIISGPIPLTLNPPPKNINSLHKQHYRIPYAVPLPPLPSEKKPSVGRRMTLYFKKDTNASQSNVNVTVTALPTPPSSTNSSLPTSPAVRNFSQPLASPAFSTQSAQSMKSHFSSSSDEPLHKPKSTIRIPARTTSKRQSVKMPARPAPNRGKSFRKSGADLLSVYTFLGGQETISSDPKNRRASRFYMDGQYQSLASPTSPGVPKVPAWATVR